MLLIRSILLTVLMIFLFPVIGQLVTYDKNFKTDKSSHDASEGICLNFIMGFFAVQGIFWILYLLLLAVNASFNTLVVLYSLTILALAGFSLNKYKGINGFDVNSFISSLKKQSKYEKLYTAMLAVSAGALLVLNGITTAGEQTYDDAEYLVTANDAIFYNTLITRRQDDGAFASYNVRNALNSWNYFIGYLSKIFNIRVTVVAHTILAVLLLLVAFVAYYYIAGKLFAERENRIIFLFILIVLYVFGSYSHYSPTFRLLASLWQHKGVLYAIILPFLVAILPDLLEKKNSMLQTLSICTATCSLSLMGTGLAAVIWGAVFLMVSIKNKKITGIKYIILVAGISALQLLAFLLIRRASSV